MAAAAGSPRNRAIILALWSSGLRVSTLCALNYGDVAKELSESCDCVMVPVYPEMKLRLPDACKGNVPYYSFVCREAAEALRMHLRERSERYGPTNTEDPLFHTDWSLWDRASRSRRRLGRRTIAKIIRRAAKLAGIPRWNHVTPHCLRKSFESVLRSPTIDGGRMDMATQQFLFGHILPHSQDAYYDRSSVDFHKREYAKLDFGGRLYSAPVRDRIVRLDELEGYLESGWTFATRLSEEKVIVRHLDQHAQQPLSRPI